MQDLIYTLPHLLTPMEVADILRIHKSHVYRLHKSGQLAGKRIGTSIRFTEKALADFLGVGVAEKDA